MDHALGVGCPQGPRHLVAERGRDLGVERAVLVMRSLRVPPGTYSIAM
jgi:hypothetical protein